MKRLSIAASRSFQAKSAAAAIMAGLAWCAADPAGAQEAKRAATLLQETKPHSDVRDSARLFQPAAVAAARKELERIERDTHLATIIETVETLTGRPIDEQAQLEAQRSGIHGIFALIAHKEKSIEVLVSRAYQRALSKPRQEAIRAAFIDGFRRNAFDEGLKQGVAAIGDALAAARGAGELPLAEQTPFRSGIGDSSAPPAAAARPLVMRNQVRLTLAGARAMIAGAMAKAQSMQLTLRQAGRSEVEVVAHFGEVCEFQRVSHKGDCHFIVRPNNLCRFARRRTTRGPSEAADVMETPMA
jgi:uncharacterized membrane protein YgcG